MKGKCLCGDIQFEIEGDLPNVYQCHCSLCRKATGSSANAATFVEATQFRWITGEERIVSYSKPTGFRSDFCPRCGSPVPNPLRNTEKVWVPVGLIEDKTDVAVAAHLHLGSKADWEIEKERCAKFDEATDLESLNQVLQQTRR